MFRFVQYCKDGIQRSVCLRDLNTLILILIEKNIPRIKLWTENNKY